MIPSHLIPDRALQTGMDPKMATARTQEVNAAYVELEDRRSRPKRSRARLVVQKTPKRHTSTRARGRIGVPLARRYTRRLCRPRTCFQGSVERFCSALRAACFQFAAREFLAVTIRPDGTARNERESDGIRRRRLTKARSHRRVKINFTDSGSGHRIV